MALSDGSDRVNRVEVVEVGPRDGLQAEDVVLDVHRRVWLIEALLAAGLRRVEVASFVHPKLIPQMAGAEDVVAALPPSGDRSYIGLVLNERGLERALTTTVDEINFVVAASDGYNQSNQGAPVVDTMAAIERMVPQALAADRGVTVTISVAFGCPYDGEVAPANVLELAERSLAAGAQEITLGDTIGAAVPCEVTAMVDALGSLTPPESLRCHFHDTRNTGIANANAAIEAGIAVLDASVGGIGGSPNAPNASGNIATEDLVHYLHRSRVETGVSLPKVLETSTWLASRLGHQLTAAIGRAGVFPAA